MKKVLWAFFVLSFSGQVIAQTAPQAEPVYGGYIEWIDAIAGLNQTRVFASTRSPNSIFYRDVTGITTSTPVFGPWTPVPDLDETDEFGYIRCFAVDEVSGYVYACTESGQFLGAGITAGSRFTIGPFFVEAVEALNGKLFYERHWGGDEYLWICNLNSVGQITSTDSTRIAVAPGWSSQFKIRILISPYDQHVYIFVPGIAPKIYKSSDIYTALSHTSTWSQLTTTDLSATGKEYLTMGIAPDGRIFAGSYEGNSSAYSAQVSYTDAGGDPWTTVVINTDCGRGNISITPGLTSYKVFFSRAISADKGLSWDMHGGADATVCADPLNDQYAYVRTDWGAGYYNHATPGVTEANDGLLAVQVNDFDMNSAKSTAWIASKSGIWHVSNYNTASPAWSAPIWPQNSSVPWTEVDCSVTADTLFCGNNDADLFRYESSKGSFTDVTKYDLVFRAMNVDSSTYKWTYGTRISAIGTDPGYAGERVFIGLYDNEDYSESVSQGAVFACVKSGSSWAYQQLTGGTLPSTGIDVNCMAVVTENGHTTLYVGVERTTTPATVNGIYRLEETAPGTWLITNDLFTAPGYPISASIADLSVTSDGTILACGTDASGTTVVSYKKTIGSTYWTVLPTSGLTPPNTGRAIASDDVNHDTYMAVDNSIYKLADGATSWTNYWTYPVGTDIQFIYYDDLLVGTGTGLYSHSIPSGVERPTTVLKRPVIRVISNLGLNQVTFRIENACASEVLLEIFDSSGKIIDCMNQTLSGDKTEEIIWTFRPGENRAVHFYRMKMAETVMMGKIPLIK